MAKPIDIAALSQDAPPMEVIPLEAYEGEPAARNGHARGIVSPQELPPRPPLFDAARAPIGMQTFTETQLPPEFIVEGLLPCDIGASIGAGGASKSTLVLWEALHVIMGWKLYGREVLRPGKALLVSSEDNVRRIRFRLRMLCEQIRDLSENAKRHIADSLLVEDLTGKGVRLVAVDPDGNLAQTSAVEQLIDAYSGTNLSIINLDPFVYFGPGERFVNDAESAMAQAAQRICNALNCAVRYVHHTGKANAREVRTDQYSARGGSALPDGMRFVQVLTRHEKPPETLPAQLTAEDVAHGRVLSLHVPKLTDAAPIVEPIWIKRTGWRFEHIVPREEAKADQLHERIRKLHSFVKGQADAGIRHTLNSLESVARDIGLGRNEVRSTLHAALELHHILEQPLPKDEQRARRKTYLSVGLPP